MAARFTAALAPGAPLIASNQAFIEWLDLHSKHVAVGAADCTEIIAWLQHLPHFRTAPVMTFVTHGEPAAADAMRVRIEREPGWTCAVPEQLDCYRIAKSQVQLLPKHLLD